MSTYIQGLTDSNYSPLIDTPDYSFLKNILDKSTQNYQTGLSKLSSSYNSITNASLTKDELKTQRDDYVKLMEKELSRVAGTDLSMPENVAAADSIFSPFWENKEMLIDANFTKKQNSQMETQDAMKTSSDEKIRNQYSAIPGIVMQQRMEKVRKAKAGDLSVYQQPIVESTPFYNLADETADYIKKMDYKITRTVAANGRIETTVNGPGTQMSYYELLNQVRGEKYAGQDNMMGQYNTINAINDIKSVNASKGKTLTDEEATKLIPEYYSDDKVKQLEKEQTINNSTLKALTDKLQLIQYDSTNPELPEIVSQIEKLSNDPKSNGYGAELAKEISTWRNKNSDEYLEVARNISYNPTRFFAKMHAVSELNAVSRVIANNQSKKIEQDKGYYDDKKLEQDWRIEHDKINANLIIAQMNNETSLAKGGKGSSGERASVNGVSGTYVNGVFKPDINGNGISDDKEKGDVTDAYNKPFSVEKSKADNNLLNPLGEAKLALSNKINRINTSQYEIIKTIPSTFTSKYISGEDANIIHSAIANNKFSDPALVTALHNVRENLVKAGVIKKPTDVTGPLSVMNAISGAIISDMEKTVDAANITPGNSDLAAKAGLSADLYVQLLKNNNALNDLYAKQKNFNTTINKEFSQAGYEKVRYKEGNNYFPVDSEYLQKNYDIPKQVADGYLEGSAKLEDQHLPPPTLRNNPNAINQQPYGGKATLGEALQDNRKPHISPNTVQGSFTKKVIEYDGKEYNVSGIYNQFGSPKELNKNLENANKKAGETVKDATYNIYKDFTAEMGRVVTYGSDQKGDKIDMGQNIANDVLGSGKKYEMYDKNPIVNLGDSDKNFVIDLFNRINKNSGEGLSYVKLHTISPYHPSKRAVELVYTPEYIKKLFSGEVNYDTKVEAFLKRKEGLMLEIKDGEQITGFPEVANMEYYEMLLTENVNKTPITQSPMEEKLGIKYQVSKDGTGNIGYKKSVRMVAPDPNDPKKFIEKWVNPLNLNESEELISTQYLKQTDNIEKFVKGLQTTSAEIFKRNLKVRASVAPIVQPVSVVNPTLAARIAAILKH
jgi:hypothetical protein